MIKMPVNKIILIVLSVLAVIGIAAAAYYYREYRTLKENPGAASEAEVKTVVGQVGNLMELPTDETPTLATILDKDKIKDQVFFKNAQNGDKLLAYTKAMKAILYRPSSNKIIEVAPLSINQPAAANTATPASLKVSYYNGSTEAGRAADAEKKVKAAHADYGTVEIKDATDKTYAKTILIDISGTHAAEATNLATLLGATVEQLPTTETKPVADILVIAGKQ